MHCRAQVRLLVEGDADKEHLLGQAALATHPAFAALLLRLGATGLVTLPSGRTAREVSSWFQNSCLLPR